MITDKIQIIERRRIEDHRGWFLKVIDGSELFLPKSTGEIYITVATPNQSKGGHYHPLANEWFTLIRGECLLELVDVETEEYYSIELTDKVPRTVFVPNNIAHNFKNTADSEFILLAYSDVLYDSSDTIMYQFFK
jgi:dTDP-4-dehydrorhamnose 3,5-epimerase-like enzyme